MAKILTSLHGKQVGLDSKGRLMVPGGLVLGDDGSQFAQEAPNCASYYDDYLGAAIATYQTTVKGTDASANTAILAGGLGGIQRITSGTAAGTIASDMVQVVFALNYQAGNGDLVFQTRFRFNSSVATRYAFLGFTDKLTQQAPIMSAGAADTFTTNATDAVGFMYDTRMATKNWWLTCKATGSANVNSTFAPVADTWETFRVSVSKTGVATFHRNGKLVGSALAGAVSLTAPLTPILAVGTFTAAAITADVDYVAASMSR